MKPCAAWLNTTSPTNVTPQTLQPTALVHEAYVRLVQQKPSDWQSRGHFYGVAAHLMRQVLVDHARRRLSDKRGAGAVQVELEEALSITAGGKDPLGPGTERSLRNWLMPMSAGAGRSNCATLVASARRRNWSNPFPVGSHRAP